MGGDYFGVHACPVKLSAEATVLHFYALIDNGGEPGFDCLVGGFEVDNAELAPHRFCPVLDRLLHDLRDLVGGAEHVNDVNRERNVRDTGVALLAQDFVGLWVYRHNLIALVLQVAGDHVARLGLLSRETDHGDRLSLAQQLADLFGVLIALALLGSELRVEAD